MSPNPKVAARGCRSPVQAPRCHRAGRPSTRRSPPKRTPRIKRSHERGARRHRARHRRAAGAEARGDRAGARARRPRCAGRPAGCGLAPTARSRPRRPPRAASIEQTLAAWQVAQNVWYGISLGSVLLLAAIGLAITFGTMGVINMAHGEMVMLGAYTTFVVQEIIRTSAPHLFDVSLLIALPLAFLVSGAVGISDRADHHPFPLRPAARHAAGDLGSLAGAAAGGALDLRPFQPRGRLAVVDVRGPSSSASSTITYGASGSSCSPDGSRPLILLLRKTPLGLDMRAVTQNRPMASANGHPHAAGRRAHLRAGLGHRRPRRRGAQPD